MSDTQISNHMTSKEAAAYLRISVDTLYRWRTKKCAPTCRIFCVIMGDIAGGLIQLCLEYQTCRIRAANGPRIAERSWQGVMAGSQIDRRFWGNLVRLRRFIIFLEIHG
jgi:hypothetical protein